MTTTRLTLEDIPPILCPDLEKLVFEYAKGLPPLPYLDELSKICVKCRFCDNVLYMIVPKRYKYKIPRLAQPCDRDCKGMSNILKFIRYNKVWDNTRIKNWDDNETTYMYESQLLE